MGYSEEQEGLNLPNSRLSEFFEDVEGKLALLTGLVPYESFGLTLEEVRRPMLVIGKPGIGKTCGILSAVKSLNEKLPAEKKLGFKKILLGQTVVGSLSGIPVVGQDGKVIRVQIPDLPNPAVDGEYGVLFLDEITTADEMQIQPALGLADDSRSLGEYKLPEHWIVIGAGNGPDCTNFVRLDDMTLTRFVGYDIDYDFKADFRPYAHKTGIHEDIIAFLNFDNSMCVSVESTDADTAGKMFPCPRSWERLSIELKMREALGKPVSISKMTNFAGRIIGVNAARKFESFLHFKENFSYNIDAIANGTERDPEVAMKKETFHIALQGLIKYINNDIKENNDGNGNFPLTTYQHCANIMTWLLKFVELDTKLNAVVEMTKEVPLFNTIAYDDDFLSMCPAFDKFFEENSDFISSIANDIDSFGF